MTKSNYQQLQKLHEAHAADGLTILAFASNQFGGQEPLPNEQLVPKMKQRYGVTFPIFSKVDINGSNAHPFFVYLKEALGGMLFSDVMWVSRPNSLWQRRMKIEMVPCTVSPEF